MRAYFWTINPTASAVSAKETSLYRATFEDEEDMQCRWHGHNWTELLTSGEFDTSAVDAMLDCHQMMDDWLALHPDDPVDCVVMGIIDFCDLNWNDDDE